MNPAFAPLFVVLVVLALDVWVYTDAKRSADAGTPVVVRVGGLVVDTPIAWFVGCVVLWIIAFPLYLVSRSR